MTCMKWTFQRLLANEVISELLFRVTEKTVEDFRTVNGATLLAWAGTWFTPENVAADRNRALGPAKEIHASSQ